MRELNFHHCLAFPQVIAVKLLRAQDDKCWFGKRNFKENQFAVVLQHHVPVQGPLSMA